MDSTIQHPDDELAQQAPLVPDLGRPAGTADPEIRSPRRRPGTDPAIRRLHDDEWAQEAPLVPDLGRPGEREGRDR